MSGVDFHQHVWPDAVRRLLERRSEPPHIRAGQLVLPTGGAFDLDAHAYSPEARLAELDRNGLDRAVASLPPTTEPTPDLVEAWHAEAPLLERDSGGRLVPLAYAAALPGFVGAIVPAPQFAVPAEARLLLRGLSERGQLAFVHPAGCAQSDPPWRTPGIAYTHQMLQAYGAWLGGGSRQFPELRVVFALLGGGAAFQVERFIRRGLDARAPFATNTWFETSSYGERALGLSLQTFGAGRLVFGSDAPVDAVAGARAALDGFGAALVREVLVSNPLALLSAERHRWAA
jgi:6-methylsalicylate decarboxylase